MKKNKYFFIAFILIVAVVAIKLIFFSRESGSEIMFDGIKQTSYTEEIKDVLAEFDSLYNISIEQSGAVGGAVVIVYKGHIVSVKCFGVKKSGENDPIDKHTVFRLASVSKTITGVLAGILAEQKIINTDDRVIDILPDFKLASEENTNKMTIGHLLSHSTGLTPHAFDLMVEQKIPVTQIMQQLYEAEVTAPPGQTYSYQNVMFSLYGLIVEKKTKRSFQQVLKEKIFVPYNMNDASCDFQTFQNCNNKAFPHVKSENGFKTLALNDRYYQTMPAAGINASISDMGQFLIALTGKGDNCLPEKVREIVFTPRIETPLKSSYYRNWGNIGPKYYALGWRSINYMGHTIAQHSGYVSGYQAEVAVCNEEQVGIAILSNSPNTFFSLGVPTFLKLFFENQVKFAHVKK